MRYVGSKNRLSKELKQADAHGDRAHVQIVLREHLDGLEDVAGIHHAHKSIMQTASSHIILFSWFVLPPLDCIILHGQLFYSQIFRNVSYRQ